MRLVATIPAIIFRRSAWNKKPIEQKFIGAANNLESHPFSDPVNNFEAILNSAGGEQVPLVLLGWYSF